MKTIDFNYFLVQWNPEVIGYEKKTTFWSDFSIAEVFGKDNVDKGLSAVEDTYNRSFDEWKSNVEYVTELALVLNHKIWYWYGVWEKVEDPYLKNYADKLARLYDKMWRECDGWCCDNLRGKDAEYYYKTTD